MDPYEWLPPDRPSDTLLQNLPAEYRNRAWRRRPLYWCKPCSFPIQGPFHPDKAA